jgi:hypothetical protein
MMELQSLSPDEMFSQPPEWMLDCQFVEENAAGLALGALDPSESLRITHHLSWCPNCAKLVHEMRKTVGYLPFTSSQAVPPASAKTRLFERINAAEHSVPPSRHTTLTIPASTTDFINTPPAPVNRSTAAPRARKRHRWEIIAAPLAAMPLVIALAIVGGWALRTQDRHNDLVAQAQTLEDKNADLSAQVSLLSNGLGDSQTRRFVLDAADSAIGGNSAAGTLVGIVNQPWANLTVWNLPPNVDGYQVIVETMEGETLPAGTFDVDANGGAEKELEIHRPLQEYRSIHVMKRTDQGSGTNDSLNAQDVLWMDLESNLGAPGGTEAYAKAH